MGGGDQAERHRKTGREAGEGDQTEVLVSGRHHSGSASHSDMQ